MITRGSLRDYLSAFRMPKLNVIQTWFRQILRGLDTLHSKRITHGHLTCEHIYINSNTGELKIGNLCLVKLSELMTESELIHRPIDDIHHFGLLALEIALAQLLSPVKLRNLIDKYYDAPTLDKIKILKLVEHIEDPQYKSLIIYCINSDSNITANMILSHPFFSTAYAKEAIIKSSRNKKMNSSQVIIPGPKPILQPESLSVSSSPKHQTVKIVKNTLKDMNITSNTVIIKLNVFIGEFVQLITFPYYLHRDTPDSIISLMRKDLKLSESLLQTIHSQLVTIFTEESHPDTARVEPERESGGDATERTSKNEDKQIMHRVESGNNLTGTISQTDCMSAMSVSTINPTAEYWRYINNNKMSAQPAQHSKKESLKSRKDLFLPDPTLSDIMLSTPRSAFEEENTASTALNIKNRKQIAGMTDEFSEEFQSILANFLENKTGEEVTNENEEGEPKKIPPSI